MYVIPKPLNRDIESLKNEAVKTTEITPIVVDGNIAPVHISKNDHVILRNSTISGKPDGFYKSGASIDAGAEIPAGAMQDYTVANRLSDLQKDISLLSLLSFDIGNNMSLSANSSVNFTLPSDGVYLLVAFDDETTTCSCVYFMGGYFSASRFKITSVVSDMTGISITGTDTTALNFTITNSTANTVIVKLYKLI